MQTLLVIHSHLRYLVLLGTVAALLFHLQALVRKAPWSRSSRVVGVVFITLVDLQVTLGLAMVLMGRFYPQLMGHIVLMLVAATDAHVGSVVNRKRTTPSHALALGVVVSVLVLMVAGILALGRPVIAF